MDARYALVLRTFVTALYDPTHSHPDPSQIRRGPIISAQSMCFLALCFPYASVAMMGGALYVRDRVCGFCEGWA